MSKFRKYGSYVALVVLTACSAGGAVTPTASAQSPHTIRNHQITGTTKHRERPLAGSGPAIQITSYKMPSEIKAPQNGLILGYGGVYYTFYGGYGLATQYGGVASFNGHYWNDYQSYHAYMESPLALDSNGNVYSVIQNTLDTTQGIVKYDPHTGVESREYISTQYELTQLGSNIALDSKNHLWIEGEPCCNSLVLGVVTNPGTPQQTFQVADQWVFSDFLGYDVPQNLTEGGDGAIWAAGESCPGDYGRCTHVVFHFSSSPPYAETRYAVPAGVGGTALGPDGNVWFTLPDLNEIGRITPSGSIATFKIPPPPSGVGTFYPGAIAAGGDGALWFLSKHHELVGRITTNGSDVSEYKTPGLGLAITRGSSSSAPAWFSVAGGSTSCCVLPGSLDKITTP